MVQSIFRSKNFKIVRKIFKRVLNNHSLNYAYRLRLTETTSATVSNFYIEDKQTGAWRMLGAFEHINEDTMYQMMLKVVQQIEIYEQSNLTTSQKSLLPYIHGKKKALFEIKSPEVFKISSEDPHTMMYPVRGDDSL